MIVESIEEKLIRPSVRHLAAIDLSDPETREFEFAHLLSELGISKDHATCITSWPEPSGIEQLYIADINSVLARGWSGADLLDELIRLDYQTIEGLTVEHEGRADQWAPVFMDHPDTWRLIVNTAKDIVGYWHFVPLFDEYYELAKQGLLIDSEITTDKVRVLVFPCRCRLYFVSLELLPKYRRSRALLLVMRSLAIALADLAKNGIFVDEICANAYTPSGEALCKTLGLRRARPHAEKGTIYCGNFAELLDASEYAGLDEIKRLYENEAAG